MRRWGLIISGFYAAVVFALLIPSSLVLFKLPLKQGQDFGWWDVYTSGGDWVGFVIWGSILVGGQALLLILSVDTSWRRLKPRRHIAISAALTGLLITFLVVSGMLSLMVAFNEELPSREWMGLPIAYWMLIFWAASWIAWGIVFYRYCRGGSMTLERAVSWLLKGSVLELMIAVPAHVIVRTRGDCSAPMLTSWGIVTGLAIMLMCFGPGVLALYKKRIDAYGATKIERAST